MKGPAKVAARFAEDYRRTDYPTAIFIAGIRYSGSVRTELEKQVAALAAQQRNNDAETLIANG